MLQHSQSLSKLEPFFCRLELYLQYEISDTPPIMPAMELVTMIEPPGFGFSEDVVLIACPPYLMARKNDCCMMEMVRS